MNLTPANKNYIDKLSYEELMRLMESAEQWWQFAPVGGPWFQGETGEYWAKRIAKLQDLQICLGGRNETN